MNQAAEQSDHQPVSLGAELIDVTRIYHQGDVEVHALRGLSLKIAEGEFTALYGPSGSGKTTALNILGGLDIPTSGKVFIGGSKLVDGAIMVQNLTSLGYQTIYSAAGPKILHLLSSGGVLDRLYLTQASRLLGGQPFASILTGPLLEPVLDLKMHTLYLDPHALNTLGQLFVSYNKSS